MTPIADLARGKWRAILPRLGVESRFLTGKNGPCPACGGKDRFRFTDHEQAGGYVCNPRGNGCGNGDGVDLLRKVNGWSFVECARQIRAIVDDVTADGPRRPKADGRESSGRLWRSAVAIGRDDLVAHHPRLRRLLGPFSDDLRFAAACTITDVPSVSHMPAMLGLLRDPAGEPVLVHRTYLGPGGKADIDKPRRMMPGTIPPGSAIRLMPYSGPLGVAEGIETALAVARDFRIPCWSAVNAGMLAAFSWPSDVTELHIFGDNDPKFGGQSAAYALAQRAATQRGGPAVQVHIPPTVGEDWLDHGNRQLGTAVAA